jgi:hypothetical protein
MYDILTVSYISHCSGASKATTVGIKHTMGTNTEEGNEKHIQWSIADPWIHCPATYRLPDYS